MTPPREHTDPHRGKGLWVPPSMFTKTCISFLTSLQKAHLPLILPGFWAQDLRTTGKRACHQKELQNLPSTPESALDWFWLYHVPWSQGRPECFQVDTAEQKGRDLVKLPPSPLQKKKKKGRAGGNFLVKFQIQLRRTREETETYNYLRFKSSVQITLIPRTLYHCQISFSLQQVYKWFGLSSRKPFS